MAEPLPRRARTVVLGAGVHGLSTAWHLGRALRARGEVPDVVVLDKTAAGAGASGIACGVVRNNYFQPAMRELMAHSVGVWQEHAEQLAYRSVGYLQVSPEAMREDVRRIHAEQQRIGYASTLVEGGADTARYLRTLFPDWQAVGSTSVLHEYRGGFATSRDAVRGLAALARRSGARLLEGVEVLGVRGDAGAVNAVETDHGVIGCDSLVVAAGPWVPRLWRMLGLPDRVDVRGSDDVVRELPMWRYLALQEGLLKVDPGLLSLPDGSLPPVLHLDSDAPLHDPQGRLVTAGGWGVYVKPDHCLGGVQGGAVPLPVPRPAEQVAVDPYGPDSRDFVVGEEFARLWTSALAHALARFAGTEHLYSRQPSGGIGAFTPDSFPVFDRLRGNVTVLADSNHGYKMVGVGALAAREVLGEPQPLLQPFRLARYARGETHPVSHSPFPWS